MKSNYEMQQQFLDYIKELSISNPDKVIDSDIVYSALIELNVKDIVNTREYYEYYENEYGNRKDVNIDKESFGGYFFEIYKGELKPNAIKLYIPQDIKHLKNSVKILFDFICSNNFIFRAKIADSIRNDNIVIRINNKDEAYKIIDFVNSNSYLKEGMINTNPFLPNKNGVGITVDNDYSYNYEVATIISNYFNELKRRKRLDLFTIDGLKEYIRSVLTTVKDIEVNDIYELVLKVTNSGFKYEDFEAHMDYKLLDKYTKYRMRIMDPEYYFESAVVESNKNNPENTRVGIQKYIAGDSNCFDINNNTKQSLIKYVKPKDVIPLMREKLRENAFDIPYNIEELLNIYLDILINNKNNTGIVLDAVVDAYLSTLRKYDINQAYYALESIWNRNDMSAFTDKEGFRTKLEKYKGLSFRKVILDNIDVRDLDINNFKEVIKRFEDAIHNKQDNEERIDGYGK